MTSTVGSARFRGRARESVDNLSLWILADATVAAAAQDSVADAVRV